SIGIAQVNLTAKLLDDRMCFWKILTTRSFALHQVWDRIHAQRIDAHIQPEAHDLKYFFDDSGIVIVQIGLVRKETVPVVLLGDRIPSPVGPLGIREDNAGAFILPIGVAPY